MKEMTLVIPQTSQHVLLGLKKQGLFGGGLWNGFGGKVKPNETEEVAAVRELREESGIQVHARDPHLVRMGVLSFYPFRCRVTVFAFNVDGYMPTALVPVATEEMTPQVFEKRYIPYDQMWKDDALWLPLFLKGVKFRGYFHFHKDGSIKMWRLEGLMR